MGQIKTLEDADKFCSLGLETKVPEAIGVDPLRDLEEQAIEELEYDRRSIEVKTKYDKVFEELKFAFGEYAPYAYAEFLSGKPARFFLDEAEIELWREIFAKDD